MTTQLYTNDNTPIYEGQHTYVQRTTHLYIKDNTPIYKGQHTYIQRTTQLYTKDNTPIYKGQHTYIRRTTHLYTKDNTCIYEGQHTYIQRTTRHLRSLIYACKDKLVPVRVMQVCGRMEVQIHSFATSALFGSGWPPRTKEKNCGTHWIGIWVATRAVLETLERKEVLGRA